MLFNSYIFLFAFLPVALAGFHLLRGRGMKPVLGWIIAISAVYYAYDQPKYLGLLAISILVNFGLGLAVQRPHGKWWLWLGLAFNVGALAYFKYSYFIVSNLPGEPDQWGIPYHMVLPLGISFITFQKIAYLVDCYRGEQAERSLLRFGAFVMFFPQLIAGPIVHPKELLPQLRHTEFLKVSWKNLAMGFTLFSLGLGKKLLLADPLIDYVSPVFAAADAGSMVTMHDAWLASLAYMLQLYFDFSAYSDMALGIALCFNIHLPKNFNSPYKATSIIDFWRRWHQTLSFFLRDYVYFTLGGSKCGRVRKHINLFITMLIGGMWHGAGWNFIFWGALHGAYLSINHMMRDKVPAILGRLRITHAITLFALLIGWIFFRATTWDGALTVVQALFSPAGDAVAKGFSSGAWFELLGLWLIVLVMPNNLQIVGILPMHGSALWQRFARYMVWQPSARWVAIVALLICVNILMLGQVTEFIYFHF